MARDIPIKSEKLEINPEGRGSLEEESRNCRYRAVASTLGDQEMYLTAHHAEDQAETLFINLMRLLDPARPVCDTIRNPRDPREMLLVVGTRTRNQLSIAPQHVVDRFP